MYTYKKTKPKSQKSFVLLTIHVIHRHWFKLHLNHSSEKASIKFNMCQCDPCKKKSCWDS